MENSTSPTDPGMEWAAQMDAQDGGPTTRRWVAVVRVAVEGESYRLAGDWAGVASANRFLRPLEARAFARATVRAYAYDLLNVARVAVARRLTLADGVPTDVFDWLDGQRPPRSPAGTVVALRSRTGAAAASMNRRVAALRACFEHEVLAGVRVANPVPAPRRGAGLRPKARGPLGHLGPGRTRGGGRLVRQPRRWPESLDPDEVGAFVADRRRDRDRALGLGMRLGGLRAGEVLGLRLAEVDPGRGRVRVVGKGGRERTVPIDRPCFTALAASLGAERPPGLATPEGFVGLHGPTTGQRLTEAGLRSRFRAHRAGSGALRVRPHRLRHT